MLEIYNESVYDLLNATGEDLDLHLKPRSEEVYVKDLSWEEVSTGKQAAAFMPAREAAGWCLLTVYTGRRCILYMHMHVSCTCTCFLSVYMHMHMSCTCICTLSVQLSSLAWCMHCF